MELRNIILIITIAGFTLSYARYGKLRNGYDVMQLHARIWKGLCGMLLVSHADSKNSYNLWEKIAVPRKPFQTKQHSSLPCVLAPELFVYCFWKGNLLFRIKDHTWWVVSNQGTYNMLKHKTQSISLWIIPKCVWGEPTAFEQCTLPNT